jgi:hypothetical protein
MARLRPFFPRSPGKPRVDVRPVLSGPKTVMIDAACLKTHRTVTSLRSKKGDPATEGAV